MKKKRLKICLLTGSYYPTVGGGETHARLLAETWAQQDISVQVVTYRRERAFVRHEEIHGVPVTRLGIPGHPRWGKYVMLLPAVWWLWRHRSEYNLIYVCGIRTLGCAAVPIARRCGAAVYLRAESCGEYSGDFINSEMKNRGVLHALLIKLITLRNKLYVRADGMIAISKVIEMEYLKAGVPSQMISHITNGISLEKYEPCAPDKKQSLRVSLGLPAQAVIFVYTGKLNRGKGLELLLRVWKSMAQVHEGIHLLLVGSGGQQYLSCEAQLRETVVSEGLEGSVTFTGYVEDVPAYLNAADIFVFPSEAESLGLSLVEAMACSLPCLASAVGGILDVVSHDEDGLLVDPYDETEWLHQMKRLLQDPGLRRRLAEQARRKVQHKFSIETVAGQHAKLFRAEINPADTVGF